MCSIIIIIIIILYYYNYWYIITIILSVVAVLLLLIFSQTKLTGPRMVAYPAHGHMRKIIKGSSKKPYGITYIL